MQYGTSNTHCTGVYLDTAASVSILSYLLYIYVAFILSSDSFDFPEHIGATGIVGNVMMTCRRTYFINLFVKLYIFKYLPIGKIQYSRQEATDYDYDLFVQTTSKMCMVEVYFKREKLRIYF